MGEQLSSLDTMFLDLEQADDGATMHFGAAMVFDPLPHGGAASVTELREHLDRRLHQLPRYRMQLSQPRAGHLYARVRGADVLLGDPGRTYLPRERLAEVASYDVPTTLCLKTSKRSGRPSGRSAPTSCADTGSSGTAPCRRHMRRAGRRRRGCRRGLPQRCPTTATTRRPLAATARFTSSRPSTCGRRATTTSPTARRARGETNRQSPGRKAGSIESPVTTKRP